MPRTRIYSDEERLERKRAAAARRRLLDPEGSKARDKIKRDRNPELPREYTRRWRAKNLARARELDRLTQARNQDKPHKILSSMLSRTRRRAQKEGIEFTISLEDISLPLVCPIYGTPFTPPSHGLKPTSYSIDRIDNAKGYVKGNVAIISQRANNRKRDLTVEDLKLFLAYIEKV